MNEALESVIQSRINRGESLEKIVAEAIAKTVAKRRAAAEAAAAEARRKQAEEAAKQQAPEAPKAPESKPAKRGHYRTPLLMAAIKAGVDSVGLVGPAGTGKTTAARLVAEELGRPFEATSFGPTTSKADLFGFISASGAYVDTGLVRAARDGGVFLGDELDAGHPGVIVGMNMVTANPVFGTPAGMVEKHKLFVPVFGMNTWCTGANRQYVGRNQLDAASLDRVFMIEWDVDWGLTFHINGVVGKPSPTLDLAEGGFLTPEQWVTRVQSLAAAVEKLGLRIVIGPRAAIMGCKLFAAGVGRRWVEEGLLWKGCDTATRAKIEANTEVAL